MKKILLQDPCTIRLRCCLDKPDQDQLISKIQLQKYWSRIEIQRSYVSSTHTHIYMTFTTQSKFLIEHTSFTPTNMKTLVFETSVLRKKSKIYQIDCKETELAEKETEK